MHHLGVDPAIINTGLKKFAGVKRRQEVRGIDRRHYRDRRLCPSPDCCSGNPGSTEKRLCQPEISCGLRTKNQFVATRYFSKRLRRCIRFSRPDSTARSQTLLKDWQKKSSFLRPDWRRISVSEICLPKPFPNNRRHSRSIANHPPKRRCRGNSFQWRI